jgi:hypothetical protein
MDLVSLVDGEICDVKKINKEEYFLIITERLDIPYDPLLKILGSVSELPLKSEKISFEDVEKENYSSDDISKILEKLWEDIEITNISEIFWPIWNIVFYKENNLEDSEIIKIDAVLGQQI